MQLADQAGEVHVLDLVGKAERRGDGVEHVDVETGDDALACVVHLSELERREGGVDRQLVMLALKRLGRRVAVGPWADPLLVNGLHRAVGLHLLDLPGEQRFQFRALGEHGGKTVGDVAALHLVEFVLRQHEVFEPGMLLDADGSGSGVLHHAVGAAGQELLHAVRAAVHRGDDGPGRFGEVGVLRAEGSGDPLAL